jgi:hypothetical protein
MAFCHGIKVPLERLTYDTDQPFVRQTSIRMQKYLFLLVSVAEFSYVQKLPRLKLNLGSAVLVG